MVVPVEGLWERVCVSRLFQEKLIASLDVREDKSNNEGKHTHQNVFKHCVGLNLIQRGLEQTFLVQFIVIIVRNRPEFLSLKMNKSVATPYFSERIRTYFLVKEFKVRGAFISHVLIGSFSLVSVGPFNFPTPVVIFVNYLIVVIKREI